MVFLNRIDHKLVFLYLFLVVSKYLEFLLLNEPQWLSGRALASQVLGNRCDSPGSSEMTILNGWPVNSRCGTLKNLTSQRPLVSSIGQHLKSLAGKGDVYLWMKTSRVWHTSTNKQLLLNVNTVCRADFTMRCYQPSLSLTCFIMFKRKPKWSCFAMWR